MKKNYIHYFMTIMLLLCFACQISCNGTYKKIQDGIVVQLKTDKALGTKHVRLQVITDDIIHVSATPADKFSDRESMMIALDKSAKAGSWSVSEDELSISLKTQTTIASVNKTTGEIVFTDLNGKVILAENKGGGKHFDNIEVEGKKAYTLQQVFESPNDEAFYGLGQHQADEYNYKGKNEVLYQYNTKISVPFVVSSKNYGILWDNYSLTKFGDPRDYAQLDQFTLLV